MIPESCDVVVIGGGPGGSTAATNLAQKGYDVVLLDKQVHPRYSVGESLIPLMWPHLDLIGVSEKIANEGFVRKMGATARWRGQIHTHTFKDFGYDRPAYHVERDRFDFILLEHAKENNVKVFEGVAVSGVNFDDPSEPVVNYRIPDQSGGRVSCRYVVDASGQGALLARQFGILEIDPEFRYMSVWGYFKGSKYIAFGGKAHAEEDLFEHVPTTFITSLEQYDDVGWGWHIPMREETSVGYVLPVDQIKNHKGTDESWEQFFLRTCMETYGYRQLLEDAEYVEGSTRLIRDYSYQAKRHTGPGYFLVGDAAGFIDPIFSIGVVLALFSANTAAWAIDRCLKFPDRAEVTQRIYQRQMSSRIELSRNMALPQYNPDMTVNRRAREALSWEAEPMLDLLNTISRLTSRAYNYKQMVDERELQPGMLIKLEKLDF